jgi:hypothetical protein
VAAACPLWIGSFFSAATTNKLERSLNCCELNWTYFSSVASRTKDLQHYTSFMYCSTSTEHCLRFFRKFHGRVSPQLTREESGQPERRLTYFGVAGDYCKFDLQRHGRYSQNVFQFPFGRAVGDPLASVFSVSRWQNQQHRLGCVEFAALACASEVVSDWRVPLTFMCDAPSRC